MRGRQICAANISECSASEWCASKGESGPVPQMGVACAAARTSLPGFEDGELLFEAEGRATSRSDGPWPCLPGSPSLGPLGPRSPGTSAKLPFASLAQRAPERVTCISSDSAVLGWGHERGEFAFDQSRMPRTALCIHTQGQALHHMYIVSLRACTPYHRT